MSVISDETNDYIKENLKKLKNPDAGASRDYSDPKQVEELEFGILDKEERHTERMLGAILKNKPLLEKLRHFVKPVHFKQHAHRRLIQMAFDYFDKYQTAPPLDSIAARINAEESDQAKRVYLTSVAESCYEAFEPAAQNPQEFLDFAADICAKNECRLAMGSLSDAMQKNKPYEALSNDIAERPKRIKELAKPNSDKKPFANLSTLLTLAEESPQQWLVPGWLQYGQSLLLASAPKAGKTTLLEWIVSTLIYGGEVFGFDVSGGIPSLYLDYEMRSVDFGKTMNTFRNNRDLKTFNQWFRYRNKTLKNEGRLPLILDPDQLRADIAQAEKETGKKGIVIIDTFRRAFMYKQGLRPGWENDAGSCGMLLGPINDVAHDTDWSIIITHHTNNAGGVSGSTDIRGAVDIFATLTKLAGDKRKLVTEGRYGVGAGPDDVIFKYDEISQSMTVVATSDDDNNTLRQAKILHARMTDLGNWLKKPEHQKLGYNDLVNSFNTQVNKRSVVRAAIDQMVELGALIRIKLDNANKYNYLPSDNCQQLIDLWMSQRTANAQEEEGLVKWF